MPDRPSKRYLDGVAQGRWSQDAGQLAALVELDRVARALLERQRAGFLRKIGFRLAGHAGVRGLYLWGGVGRGKTMLCDLLLDACAELKPTRLHYHRFMQDVHARMKALIEKDCVVHRLGSDTDFRLRQLTCADTWHVPIDAAGEAQLAEHFRVLNGIGLCQTCPLSVNGRDIPAKALGEGVAWFDFEALCEGPRSAADYIEIAREHHTLLLSGVPTFSDESTDAPRRFIHLVDELYDRHVNLVATAAAQPPGLYRGFKLRIEFERTVSRLVEMRSAEYLAKAHRP